MLKSVSQEKGEKLFQGITNNLQLSEEAHQEDKVTSMTFRELDIPQ